MKHCENCQGENPSEARFCRFCGTPFEHPEAPEDSAVNNAAYRPTSYDVGEHAPLPAVPVASAAEEEGNGSDHAGAWAGTPSGEQPDDQPVEQIPQPQSPFPPQQLQQPQQPGQAVPPFQQSFGFPLQQPQQSAQQSQQPGPNPAPGQFQAAPSAQTSAAQAQASAAGKQFGEWLLNSLKRPSAQMKSELWFGFVSAALTSLVMALCAYVMLTVSANKATSSASMAFLGYDAGYSVSIPIGLLFGMWLIFAVGIYFVILAVFIGKKLFGDEQNFADLHTAVAQRLVPFTASFVVLTLLAAIGVTGFAAVLFLILNLLMWQIVPMELGRSRFTRPVDPFWIWAAALLITAVFAFIEFTLFGWLAAGTVGSELSVLF